MSFRSAPVSAPAQRLSAPLLSLVALLALTACGGQEQAPPAPPPPSVIAVTVGTESVPNIVELPGRIAATRTAEVRARTDGIVERRLYQEGTDVAAGQALFSIDARDYRAQVAQAQAALTRAQAARTNAAAIVRRYQPLVSERAVSAQEYDAALADQRQADASVADARAALARSQLQLGYTVIRSPIAGRVGRAEVTEGALVNAAQATLMTRVDQMSPVYAVFTQSNAEILALLRQQQTGQLRLPSLSRIEVQLLLEDGTPYGAVGHLDFADQSVDPTTGAQTLRATFPNTGRTLLPGQFVRGRIAAGTLPDGITLPQRAVQITGEQATVSVVAQDGSVTAKPVQLGGLVNGRWIIKSGLKKGERVIVEGWQKVRPGQKVTVRAPGQKAPGPNAAPAPAASAKAG